MNYQKKIEKLHSEFEILNERIADPHVLANPKEYCEISARFKEVSEILQYHHALEKAQKQLIDNTELSKQENDEEMLLLIEEEYDELKNQCTNLEKKILTLLVPKDKNDVKHAIMEIRAGTGGDEAALFTANLFRMYSHYIEKMGWKIDIINSNPTGIGGFKEISFEVIGRNAFGALKFESGVHRVQRVPETESSGRIHTSASSVVVLPEADEIDFHIDEKDLKIDVYRSSGPGGQSVNTTDSAVRITHKPTGVVVTCQDEKSQLKNKAKALKVLRSRLLDFEIQKQQQEISSKRRLMVGSGDRSAKIRTYNFPQSRITDHRIGYTSHNLEAVMNGEIQELIDALHLAMQAELMDE